MGGPPLMRSVLPSGEREIGPATSGSGAIPEWAAENTYVNDKLVRPHQDVGQRVSEVGTGNVDALNASRHDCW